MVRPQMTRHHNHGWDGPENDASDGKKQHLNPTSARRAGTAHGPLLLEFIQQSSFTKEFPANLHTVCMVSPIQQEEE
jgi:hypothetical protein